MMPLSSYFSVGTIFALLFSFTSHQAASADNHENFIQCLYSYPHSNSTSISKVTYTRTNPSYSSIFGLFSIQNFRFFTTKTTPIKPLVIVIVTPLEASEIQATVVCGQRHKVQLRTRSGGHDYEGLYYSYGTQVPFVVLDLINLREIKVDLENKTAWVQVGATAGELYYRISQKSKTLGFPAGVCSTMGVGEHFSGGGGYGFLMRKYGLVADNIIDANMIDVKGRFLNRESMGEDLFWDAIRSGCGGSSFGVNVITAWKIKLVHVPSTVTVFRVSRTSEQNATDQLIHKWKLVANKLDEDLTIRLIFPRVFSSPQTGKPTIEVIFESLFLGGVDKLIPLVEESLPELGLVKEDCIEMSWIESVHYLAGFTSDQPLEVLLNRTQSRTVRLFKARSEYVNKRSNSW